MNSRRVRNSATTLGLSLLFLLLAACAFIQPADAAGPYYVNDTSTVGDSFTTAVGSDANTGASPAAPFRTLIKAMATAVAGDTIYIDAGIFDSYTVVNGSETAGVNVDKDSIALIGADSNTTVIDPPGPKTEVGIYGIYADTQANLTIKNIGVTGAYEGLYFYNVKRSRIENDSASSNGYGIDLQAGSDTNTLINNMANSNTNYGIWLSASANNTVSNNTTNSSVRGIFLNSASDSNLISGNTANSNSNWGVILWTSSKNTVSNNTTNSCGSAGIYLNSSASNNMVIGNTASSNLHGIHVNTSSNNTVIHNAVRLNSQQGIYLASSSNVSVIQNSSDSNTRYQIYIDGTSSSDTVQKNNIQTSVTNRDSGAFNSTGNTFDFTRNYWNRTDSAAIGGMIFDTGSVNRIIYAPFRLGAVDTAAGADTTAPKAPDTAAVVGAPSDTSIILEWSAVTALEEPNGGAVGLSGYRVYRSRVKDTSSWERVVEVGSAVTRWQDTDVSPGARYYYRVTAFDSPASGFVNESFFSDSQPFDSAVLTSAVNIFVNDSVYIPGADSYTYAAGSDVTGNGTRQNPFASIPRAMQFATAGDTIWIDAGLFDSYANVGAGTAAIRIDVDTLSIIGRDSGATVIDPPGDSSLANLYGVYALARSGLLIKNIGVRGAKTGMYLEDVIYSTVTGCSVASNSGSGFNLAENTDTCSFTGNQSSYNSEGFNLGYLARNNTMDNNLVTWNSGVAVWLSGSMGCTLSNSFIQYNKGYPVYVHNAAANNIVTGNVIDSNFNTGVYIYLNSTNNTVSGNTITSNTGDAVNIDVGTNNTLIGNFIARSPIGVRIINASSGNRILRNRITSNTNYGIDMQLTTTGGNNTVIQNTIDSNVKYQVYLGNAPSCTVQKNNFIMSPTNPDSAVYSTQAGLDFTRNWWGVADSIGIQSRIADTFDLAKIVYIPFRLGEVDTTGAGDTSAPKAPDTVAVAGAPSDTSIILEWSAVTALEEPNGGAVGLSGYRVYRSRVKDTSSWERVVEVGSAVTRWQDTDVELGARYYYRVTAFDSPASGFVNESFFSDSQPFDSAVIAGAVDIFVNDTAWNSFTDSFTYAIGNDTTGRGTRSQPFRTIIRAMQFATAGDTIWVDAGLYDSFVIINGTDTAGVNIDKDSITLIGADSNATVIDPVGPKTQLALYGIYAKLRQGISIRNIGVTGAYYGIGFDSVQASSITGDSVTSCGGAGIYLTTGSDSNLIRRNISSFNTNYNLWLASASCANLVDRNTFMSTSSSFGVWITGSHANVLVNNVISSNALDGIRIQTSANNNTLAHNIISSNGQNGVMISPGSNNTFAQNLISNNTQYQIRIGGASAGNAILKNNIFPSTGNPDSGVSHTSGSAHDFTRNWWAVTDSQAVKNRISDTSLSNLIQFQPWRLTPVDTTAGADTTAPKAPDSVAIIAAPSDTSITLEWSAVTTLDEPGNGGAVGLAGYRVYRSRVKDTSSWERVVEVGSAVTRWQDTDVSAGARYYYRVTAFDSPASGFVNESFFSDSQPFDSAVLTSAVELFVNDSNYASFSDSFTYAAGSDVTGNGTRQKPFATITNALAFATAGDTVFIDAGTFAETVVIGVDSVSLIGKDSNATVIDPPGSNATGGLYGIYATGRRGLLIKTLGVTGANRGIFFNDVDLSTITGDSISACGAYGILLSGSDTVTVSACMLIGNQTGYYTDASNDTLTNTISNSNSSHGADVSGWNHTITNNTFNSNTTNGVTGAPKQSAISGNTVTSNGNGFTMGSFTDTNTFSNNTVQSNTNHGFLLGTSSGNTVTGNTVTANLYGLSLGGDWNGNTVSSNTVASNTDYGIRLNNSSRNTVVRNTVNSNLTHGIILTATSIDNVFVHNTLDSNAKYQVYVESAGGGSPAADTFVKNNIRPSPTNADSGVYNSTANTFDFTRNWWTRTDSASISQMMFDTGGVNRIRYQPFRFGAFDTAAGADTTAPKSPDSVAIIGAPSDTSITLEWSAVTALEEANGGAVGLSGYRVYRSKVKDTSSWIMVKEVGASTIRHQDTDVGIGQVFYYRVTAFDSPASGFVNESFFSDSQPFDSAVAQTRTNWYVNDGVYNFFSDSFTYASGSDTLGEGTAQKPFGTITKALSLATAGDTVWVDRGTYAETVTIGLSNISLIGMDSNATVIDPPGGADTGIQAANVSGLLIKNLGILTGGRGISFSNVDLSTISGDSVSNTTNYGIILENGSDTNVVENSLIVRNSTGGSNYALFISGDANIVRRNIFIDNVATNIIVTTPAKNNIVESNTITGGTYGVWLNQTGVRGSIVRGNDISGVTQIGIPLDTTDSNFIRQNTIKNAALRGINLYNSHGNVIEMNRIDSGGWMVYLDGNSGGNTIQKNNFFISPNNPDSGIFHSASYSAAVTRNWWGTADDSTIRRGIQGNIDSVTTAPFRIGPVDTSSGADTTAPAAPTAITLDSTSVGGAIRITWTNPTLNEETNGGALGFQGLNIYRLKNLADTPHWAAPGHLVRQTLSSDTNWTDTDVAIGVTYYYRLTSRDTAALYINESFLTDTKWSNVALAANTTAIWYVNNETHTIFGVDADSFSASAGSDTAGNGTRGSPYRTIMKALDQMKAGDTLYIDVGLYAETVVIDTDNVSLIGADSGRTVIDPPGANTTPGLYGIYADTQTGLSIKNLGVTGAYDGIHFYNVDQSAVSGDSVSACGNAAIYLRVNSDSNTISGNAVVSNPNYGIYLSSATGNTIIGNVVNSNLFIAVKVQAGAGNTLSGNTVNGNNYGIQLDASSGNAVTGNAVNGNSQQGIYLYQSSAIHNIVTNNIANNNSYGLYVNAATDNIISRNTFYSNATGVWLGAASNNAIVQNTIDSNAEYQVYVWSQTSSNTIQKNLIRTSPANPDSGLLNTSGNAVSATRNWWGDSDYAKILKKISDTASIANIQFSPFRLGPVDTAAGADTTAPAAPTGDTLDNSVAGQIRVSWVIPTLNEETSGGAVAFAGARVYRLTGAPDTTHWGNALVWTAGPNDTTWTDTTATTSDTYYYRLTSRDTAAIVNESFFTDTKSIRGVPVSLTLSTPNGGEVFLSGETRTIAWNTSGSVPTVTLEFSSDTGLFFSTIASSISNIGSYAWGVPAFTVSEACRIRIKSAANPDIVDTSDANFSIRNAFWLSRPGGGETFVGYSAETITWTSTGSISSVRLEYSVDSGLNWSVIAASTSNFGSYIWTVPNMGSSQVKVRVLDANDTRAGDSTDTIFSITAFPVPPPADKIRIVSGDTQLGRVSQFLDTVISVKVVDTGGVNGVEGARVTFQIASFSPQTGATFGNSFVSSTIAYTDAFGIASDTVRLGSQAGVYAIEARTDSVTPAKSVYFTLYADGREVPPGGATAGQGWRMLGPNKAVPPGWNLKSPLASGGLPNAAAVYQWNHASSSYNAASGDAVRGRAYWIKDASGGRVFVPSEGFGTLTDTVAVRLAVGWNQIASGQYFYVNWDSGVRFDTSAITDTAGLADSERFTPAQAADTARAIIQNKVYWYTGSNYVYAPASETVSLASTRLKPMAGFWLYVTKACTMYVYPRPSTPETYATEILQQSPSMLSAAYKQSGVTATEDDWAIQLVARAGDMVDWQNYVGVKSSASARLAASAREAPGVASGYVSLAVRPAASAAEGDGGDASAWMAASYAAPDKTKGGHVWDVNVATDLAGATLTWDNTVNLPAAYDIYLIGGPAGPVNMRSAASLTLSAPGHQSTKLSLIVGATDFVAPFLAAALSSEHTFAYPNPGPDATGGMTFKYNLPAAADVSIKIFDVGGKLVRELKTTGAAGSNTVAWDSTNKYGQRVGSGVYIYILESSGNRRIDKLAIVR